jgi:predicted aminopeptidase
MKRFAFLLLLPSLCGCYLLTQAGGQIGILLNSRNIDTVLADPSVPAETKVKLRLIKDIKVFGESELGLTHSSNYESFYDTQGQPITYVVSACPKDRFQPYLWWFPIVGKVPYKGFFAKEDAQEEARALKEEGYDVAIGTAAAYSTLGYFSDPVLSTMLDYPEEELVALILHELTHGTIYRPGSTDFNEGLASFVGWKGALEFACYRHGIASEEYARTACALAEEEQLDAKAQALFTKLDDLYKSHLSLDHVLSSRERIAGGEVNNAEILMQRRYGRYNEFQERFEKVGEDWRRFFESLRKEKLRPKEPS